MNQQIVREQTETIPALRQQPGESIDDWMLFIWWALADGELHQMLAQEFKWAERRQVIETYEALETLTPGGQVTEAMMSRVRVTLVEMMKLERRSMSTPEQVLSEEGIFKSLQFLQESAAGMEARKAASMDWSKLTPDERETMIAAKQIQDRLMNQI